MKELIIKESTIESKLHQLFDTGVSAELVDETEKSYVFKVRIFKPKNYHLYNWLKSKIGKRFVLSNEEISSKELIILDQLKIETINDIVDKIKELNKESWGFKIMGFGSDSENEENKKGIILSWEEGIPF